MGLTSLIFLATGVFLILFGLAAMFYPNLSRWINAAGIKSPMLKALICMLTGAAFIILSETVPFPV